MDRIHFSDYMCCVFCYSKAGVSEVFEGHVGPVTGIHTNSVPGSIDFSQDFLSSSFDWTVKLWNAKVSRGAAKASARARLMLSPSPYLITIANS